MKAPGKGFTLVELIVVIVILGILAATALPRFVNLQGDARVSVMAGLAGGMEGAKELIRAKWLATGSTSQPNVVTQDGTSVAVNTGTGSDAGLPTAAGMQNAVSIPTAVGCAGSPTLTCTYTGFTSCTVTYNSTTGVVTRNTALTDCGG